VNGSSEPVLRQDNCFPFAKKRQEGEKLPGQGCSVRQWLFLSMAYYRLKQAEEAQRRFAKRVRSLDQVSKEEMQESLQGRG
jgi:hypothetical protein